ncbi:MAG: pirin family protein [Candidatus Thermoplasmatota archaeon]|nr:pirin family protein [Candidatus Thermoplasmatota archaeon]
MKTRAVKSVLRSMPTIEGAGVHLRRAFGPHEAHLADPFLLLDHFQSENHSDYTAGFPWHPHRGIETVTYMIRGTIEHEDSLGNKGVIESGDVQWMTAGSGILHQEMPKPYAGDLLGVQLWVNLPASKKMKEPRYREIRADQIPAYSASDGVEIKIIAGNLNGIRGPVRDLVADIAFLDVTLERDRELAQEVDPMNSCVAYVFEGDGIFSEEAVRVSHGNTVFFKEGNSIKVKSDKTGMRLLLITGRALREPIAWGGPIVMNKQSELDRTFDELRNGTFIKSERPSDPNRLQSFHGPWEGSTKKWKMV